MQDRENHLFLTDDFNCYCLGYKVGIPKKSDRRGWKALHLESRRRHLAFLDKQSIKRVREMHAAERRITLLRARGLSKDRKRIIEKLKMKIKVAAKS